MRFSTQRRQEPQRDPNLVTELYRLPPQIRLVDMRDNVAESLRSRVISKSDLQFLLDDTGLDLYLVNAEIDPPVYKLLDYGKFKFDEQKRLREASRKQRENTRTMKEIFFNPGIGEHDVQTKVNHIKDLLEDHDVKIAMKLNRHNKFMLTSRWTIPLGVVLNTQDFVLNRVLKDIGEAVVQTRVTITDNQAFATLRKKP